MPDQYQQEFTKLTNKGWIVISESESGAQLQKPKTIKLLDLLCLLSGFLCLFMFPPLGIILIIIAVIDYALLTKQKSMFLHRTDRQ